MRPASFVLLLTMFATPAAAQAPASAMPEGYRDVLLRKLTLERSLLLAMADSMPEDMYRDKATPAQRDFAQQIQHATVGISFFVPRFMNATRPELPDTATALNSRAGLRDLINRTYDFAETTLKGQSLADLNGTVEFFRMTIPRWQVWDELHMHAIWTAGQVVANFRKHGMAPPGFSFF